MKLLQIESNKFSQLPGVRVRHQRVGQSEKWPFRDWLPPAAVGRLVEGVCVCMCG